MSKKEGKAEVSQLDEEMEGERGHESKHKMIKKGGKGKGRLRDLEAATYLI